MGKDERKNEQLESYEVPEYFQKTKKFKIKKKVFQNIFKVLQNFVKTLKIRVKLILNCSQAHAITYTKRENGQFDHILFLH